MYTCPTITHCAHARGTQHMLLFTSVLDLLLQIRRCNWAICIVVQEYWLITTWDTYTTFNTRNIEPFTYILIDFSDMWSIGCSLNSMIYMPHFIQLLCLQWRCRYILPRLNCMFFKSSLLCVMIKYTQCNN